MKPRARLSVFYFPQLPPEPKYLLLIWVGTAILHGSANERDNQAGGKATDTTVGVRWGPESCDSGCAFEYSEDKKGNWKPVHVLALALSPCSAVELPGAAINAGGKEKTAWSGKRYIQA